MGGIALILAGALLVILGDSDLFSVDILGATITLAAPGLIVVGLGFVVLFLSGRQLKGGGDYDPESHLHTVRADHHYDVNGDGVIDSSDFHDDDDDD